MKIPQVIPAFKKGTVEQITTNYGPINILNQFKKLLEKIISKRLYKFFEKNNLFTHHQYGFRKKCSTVYAIYDILEEQRKSLNQDMKLCAIYLDLSKAFDTVNHTLLLRKLDHYC